MSTDIASLVLRVDSLEARRAADDVARLGREGGKTEGAMTSLGRTLRSIGAGVTIGAVLGSIIRNTIEAEQAQAQLAARLKSTGAVSGMTMDSLKGLAQGLMNVTTFSDEAIMASEALLLTFTKIGSEVFPQAQEAALNMSIALGSDLQSATMQLGKALNDPVKGVAALGRAGVQFTKDQKEVIKALVATGRAADAQKIILQELETQMGGAARAARNTLGGAIQNLKNQFGELLEGDSKGEGVRGATASINEFANTLSSPATKQAIGGFIQGLFKVANAATQVAKFVKFAAQGIGITIAAIVEQAAAMAEVTKNIGSFGFADGTVAGGFKRATTNARNYREAIEDLKLSQVGLTRKDLPSGFPNFQLPGTGKPLPGIGAPLQGSFRAATQQMPSMNVDTSGLNLGGGGASKAKGGGATDSAKSAAEARARDLESLRADLRTEEEEIQASYANRIAEIAKFTELSKAERQKLTDAAVGQRDEGLAALQEEKGRELEELRMSLRTQEEVIQESYAKRLAIVVASTEEGSVARQALQVKLQTERDNDLQAYQDSIRAKQDALYQGLLTEDEMTLQAFDRQREMILRNTEITETMRQDLLNRLRDSFNAQQVAKEQAVQQKIVGVTAGMFGALAQLAGSYAKGKSKEAKKAFEMQKKFSIAQALINTYESASAAYKSMVGIPYVGPALAVAAAAAAVLAGIAQVRNIQSQQFTEHDQGGRIPAGKIGIVGEYGPEFVRGPAAITGRQLTQQTMKGAGGNANVSLTSVFNIQGGEVAGETTGDKENSVREFKALVDSRFQDLIMQEQRAGGSLWRMKYA